MNGRIRAATLRAFKATGFTTESVRALHGTLRLPLAMKGPAPS